MSFFEKIVEFFFMVKLALSPILLGILGGGFVVLTSIEITMKILGYGIMVLGLVLGVVLVWRVKKKKLATDFMAEVMATPELDGKKDEN
jgi:uncharacterized membrane protein YqjE